jgi:two-component system invasion response regulator UvrY
VIKVLLVDDHELVRTGIESILSASMGINVVGVAGSGEEALEIAANKSIDVVLMDINMPGIGGIEATKRFARKHPEMKVIALSVHEDGPIPNQLMNAGAHGYLCKNSSAGEMIAAIQRVSLGKRYLSTTVANNLFFAKLDNDESPFDCLSQREMQVVLMTLQGMTVNEMGSQLIISPKTVSTYRRRLYEKLGTRNEVELTQLAIKYNLQGGNP